MCLHICMRIACVPAHYASLTAGPVQRACAGLGSLVLFSTKALRQTAGGNPARNLVVCKATACGANGRLVLVGVECPAGKIDTGSHDAPAGNTASESTTCTVNEMVVAQRCAKVATKAPKGTHSWARDSCQPGGP